MKPNFNCCYSCEKRFPGCHAHCAEYAAALSEYRAKAEALKTDEALAYTQIKCVQGKENYNRMRKRTGGRKYPV